MNAPYSRNRMTAPIDEHIKRLSPAWQAVLNTPKAKAALLRIAGFLASELAEGVEIYPHQPFRALELVQPEDVRVVILGQDPYHGPNQAQGLAFSVPDICPRPPSLRNIFQELAAEFPDAGQPKGHELTPWARQGVLLLNTSLTVQARQPASHAKKGWEEVTDAIIEYVAKTPQPKVFLLWGAHAQAKQPLLTGDTHGPLLILTTNHPSPLSARRPPKPFMGCNHFIQANQWLEQHGQLAIQWLAAGKS